MKTIKSLVRQIAARLAEPTVAPVRAQLQSEIEARQATQKALDELKVLHEQTRASLDDEVIRRELLGELLFRQAAARFVDQVGSIRNRAGGELSANTVEELSLDFRSIVRHCAGLTDNASAVADTLQEIAFLHRHAKHAGPAFQALAHKRVLYAGQCYYNTWYLSRGLRDLGWKADVLNWDMAPASQIYYHGHDISFEAEDPAVVEKMLAFYASSLYGYDVFHFSNAHGISFGWPVTNEVGNLLGAGGEIHLLKALGKKIAYTNNGCFDGVSQTSFSQWGPESVCSICRWRDVPSVCSDERNLAWGRFRNSVADYQCMSGGNRVDFNDDPRVHESPEFLCLDPGIWTPDLEIPDRFRLPGSKPGTLWLYHAVGNRAERTDSEGVNIKSSHVYLPLIENLKSEGLSLELLEPTGIPNRDVRFIQAQADIFLDMLTYGWFGANAREAMMLGKPVVCFIRPEWLESVAQEVPEYAAELPVISATPATIEVVLRGLIASPEMRKEYGRRGREFAIKWYSPASGARKFDEIYTRLIRGELLLRSDAQRSQP